MIAVWLMAVGPLASGGMSAAPISWVELDAWVRRSGYDPDPWAADTLMEMSRAYLGEVNRSNEARTNAPFASGDLRERRAIVSASQLMFEAAVAGQTRKQR